MNSSIGRRHLREHRIKLLLLIRGEPQILGHLLHSRLTFANHGRSTMIRPGTAHKIGAEHPISFQISSEHAECDSQNKDRNHEQYRRAPRLIHSDFTLHCCAPLRTSTLRPWIVVGDPVAGEVQVHRPWHSHWTNPEKTNR